MSILRINIEFFGPNMASSQLPLIFWILKGWYLQNEKVLEAQILTGLYWDYISSTGNEIDIFKIWPKGGYVPLRSRRWAINFYFVIWMLVSSLDSFIAKMSRKKINLVCYIFMLTGYCKWSIKRPLLIKFPFA